MPTQSRECEPVEQNALPPGVAFAISAADCETYWARIEPIFKSAPILQALEDWAICPIIDDLHAAIAETRLQLWGAMTPCGDIALALTCVVPWANGRSCTAWLACRVVDRAVFLSLLDKVNAWAGECDCMRLEIKSPAGWGRSVAHGWAFAPGESTGSMQ
jgi:hypothetical protein